MPLGLSNHYFAEDIGVYLYVMLEIELHTFAESNGLFLIKLYWKYRDDLLTIVCTQSTSP